MRHSLVAATVVAALTVVACGDDDASDNASLESTEQSGDTTVAPTAETTAANGGAETTAAPGGAETTAATSSDATAPTDATAEPGTAGPATGEPVRVGLINLEGGARVSIPEFRIGAVAATEYANDQMGGIGGRPIELVRCNTDGTPESSAACANEMVDEGVAVVALGVDTAPDQIVQVLSAADVLYVANTGNSPVELTTPGVFAFTAGVPSTIAGYASIAASEGYSKMALLVIDQPSATQPVDSLGASIFESAGVELEVIKIPPGTPDMSAQLAAAISGGADIIGTLADPAFCLTYYSAYEAVGADVASVLGNSCIRTDVLAEAPDALLDAAYVSQKLRLDDEGPEGQLYHEVLETYAPDAIAENPNLSGGYATMMGLARMLNDYTGEFTPEGLADALASTSAPYPLGPGVEIRCNGEAIPSLPNACSAHEFLYRVTPERSLELLDSVDVSALLG